MDVGQSPSPRLSLLTRRFFFPVFDFFWNKCGVDVYILYPGQISSLTRYHEAFPWSADLSEHTILLVVLCACLLKS